MEVNPYLLEFQVLQHGGPHLLDGKTVSLPKSFEQSCGYSLSFSIVHQGGVYRNANEDINKQTLPLLLFWEGCGVEGQ